MFQKPDGFTWEWKGFVDVMIRSRNKPITNSWNNEFNNNALTPGIAFNLLIKVSSYRDVILGLIGHFKNICKKR